MNTIDKKFKSLAAYALYYQLKLENISTINVVEMFIQTAALRSPVKEMDCDQLHSYIDAHMGLDIPLPVIIKAANKCSALESLGNSKYRLSDKVNNEEIDKCERRYIENDENVKKILDDIISFIESKENRSLDEQERYQVQKDLAHCLIQKDKVDGFKPHINAYIKEHSDNAETIRILDEISMGVIVFYGLQEDSIEEGWKVFKRPLTLILDTEILLDIMEYNGPEHKKLAEDFINQIRDIRREAVYKNSKIQSPIVLAYFPEAEEEINSLFHSAKAIRKNGNIDYVRTSAMRYILSKCKDNSEVAILNQRFWEDIEAKGIEMWINPIPTDEEDKVNCIVKQDYICGNDPEEEQWINLKSLNDISHLRGNRHNNETRLENIGYLLVSGTKDVLSKSQMILKDEDTVTQYPLGLGLFEITARLWLKLHRGMGASTQMPSLQVVNQASLAINSHNNLMLMEKYQDVLDKHRSNKISEEQLKTDLYALRKIENEIIDAVSENADAVLTLDDLEYIMRSKSAREDLLQSQNEEFQRKIDAQNHEHKTQISQLTQDLNESESRRQEAENINAQITQNFERVKKQQINDRNNESKDKYQKEMGVYNSQLNAF